MKSRWRKMKNQMLSLRSVQLKAASLHRQALPPRLPQNNLYIGMAAGCPPFCSATGPGKRLRQGHHRLRVHDSKFLNS